MKCSSYRFETKVENAPQIEKKRHFTCGEFDLYYKPGLKRWWYYFVRKRRIYFHLSKLPITTISARNAAPGANEHKKVNQQYPVVSSYVSHETAHPKPPSQSWSTHKQCRTGQQPQPTTVPPLQVYLHGTGSETRGNQFHNKIWLQNLRKNQAQKRTLCWLQAIIQSILLIVADEVQATSVILIGCIHDGEKRPNGRTYEPLWQQTGHRIIPH